VRRECEDAKEMRGARHFTTAAGRVVPRANWHVTSFDAVGKVGVSEPAVSELRQDIVVVHTFETLGPKRMKDDAANRSKAMGRIHKLYETGRERAPGHA